MSFAGRLDVDSTLRRLSGESEPHWFGVVWSGGELAGRWLTWALLCAFLVGIAS